MANVAGMSAAAYFPANNGFYQCTHFYQALNMQCTKTNRDVREVGRHLKDVHGVAAPLRTAAVLKASCPVVSNQQAQAWGRSWKTLPAREMMAQRFPAAATAGEFLHIDRLDFVIDIFVQAPAPAPAPSAPAPPAAPAAFAPPVPFAPPAPAVPWSTINNTSATNVPFNPTPRMRSPSPSPPPPRTPSPVPAHFGPYRYVQDLPEAEQEEHCLPPLYTITDDAVSALLADAADITDTTTPSSPPA